MPHPRSKRMLSVYPNPYELDHEGRLSGVCRYDPDHGRRGDVHFVAATPNRGIAQPSDKAGHPDRKLGGGRHTRFDITYTFDMWPHDLPHTDYFVDQIKRGGLVAADAWTAKMAGQSFIPAADRLAEHRAAAIARFVSEYGEAPDESGWPDVTPHASQNDALAASATGGKAAVSPAAPPEASTPLIVPQDSTPSAALAAEGSGQ